MAASNNGTRFGSAWIFMYEGIAPFLPCLVSLINASTSAVQTVALVAVATGLV
jgi:hypothetical protein